MNVTPKFYRRARMSIAVLASFSGRPWQPKMLAQRGKVLTIVSQRRGVDMWAWVPERERQGCAMSFADFTAIKDAVLAQEGNGTLLLPEGRAELVMTYAFRYVADGSSFLAVLVPAPAQVVHLSEALALEVLIGNKGRGGWTPEHEERWIYASLLAPTTMSEWNGSHPVDTNSRVREVPAGTTVLVTMFSGWGGDVGIRARNLTPPGHGYDARVQPEALTDWRCAP